MGKKPRRIFSIFIRYAIIVLLSIGNFKLIYKLLTPATIKVLAMVLRLFYDIVVIENFIYVRGATVEVASSCIIALAYFLMAFLVFSTPDIKPKKRVFAFMVSFVILFIYNIVRMVFLVLIIHSPYFDIMHWILQDVVSMILVAVIWLGMASLMKIKSVPLCTDLKYVFGLIKKTGQ